jgi:hypothetical protein
MARKWTCGFESQQASTNAPEGLGFASGSINTTSPHGGLACGQCTNGQAFISSNALPSLANGDSVWIRAFVRKNQNPTVTQEFLAPGTLNGSFIFTPYFSVAINTDGTVQMYDNGTARGSASAALLNNAWYRVEAKFTMSTVAPGSGEFYLDGALVASVSGAFSQPAFLPAAVRFGDPAARNGGMTLLLDDLAINDASDVSQNTYPGDGKVINLLPVSDSAIGGWTAGAGATTNLWNALDNVPPAGLALGSATDTSQVKSATNSASDNLDVTLQSYASAGLTSGDTIAAVQPISQAARTAVSTDTAIALVSNPIIAEKVTPISGSGGTSPAGWNPLLGNVMGMPAVTRSVGPVLRVGKRTATTSVLHCDYAALIVDYIPSAAPLPPNKVVARTQAVNRASTF